MRHVASDPERVKCVGRVAETIVRDIPKMLYPKDSAAIPSGSPISRRVEVVDLHTPDSFALDTAVLLRSNDLAFSVDHRASHRNSYLHAEDPRSCRSNPSCRDHRNPALRFISSTSFPHNLPTHLQTITAAAVPEALLTLFEFFEETE